MHLIVVPIGVVNLIVDVDWAQGLEGVLQLGNYGSWSTCRRPSIAAAPRCW